MVVSESLRVKTSAKLNLFLSVLGRRGDGYHELQGIFHSVDLFDDLVASPSDGDITVHVESEQGEQLLPELTDNLIYKAALVLRGFTGEERGADLQVVKRIPIGGGLGGGSSNAAGALLALDRLWGSHLDQSTLLELAAGLGSDVPFCIGGAGTSLVTGRGEQLAPLPPPPTLLWFVLGLSDTPLLTPEVYAALTEDEIGVEQSPAPMTMALAAGDVSEVAALLSNDLEAPALRLRPELADARQALLDAGALGAGLSGSGPTLFGVVGDRKAAEAVADRVTDVFDRVAVVCSTPSCVTFE
ncbi:MAG: 4-(cytidine 5'-diphospho)-2-C-methyl-D-erythritol kinase [Actinomycetota bacterium]